MRAFFLVRERRPDELVSAGKETGGGRPCAGSWRDVGCFSAAMTEGVRSSRLVEVALAVQEAKELPERKSMERGF